MPTLCWIRAARWSWLRRWATGSSTSRLSLNCLAWDMPVELLQFKTNAFAMYSLARLRGPQRILWIFIELKQIKFLFKNKQQTSLECHLRGVYIFSDQWNPNNTAPWEQRSLDCASDRSRAQSHERPFERNEIHLNNNIHTRGKSNNENITSISWLTVRISGCPSLTVFEVNMPTVGYRVRVVSMS